MKPTKKSSKSWTVNPMANDIQPIDVLIVDFEGIPSFDTCEDHPMHRKAKLQHLKKKPISKLGAESQSTVVTCPECGVTFDSNYTKKDGDHERNS